MDYALTDDHLDLLADEIKHHLSDKGHEHYHITLSHEPQGREHKITLMLDNNLLKGETSFYASRKGKTVAFYSKPSHKRNLRALAGIIHTAFLLNNSEHKTSIAFHMVNGAMEELNQNPTPIKARPNPAQSTLSL